MIFLILLIAISSQAGLRAQPYGISLTTTSSPTAAIPQGKPLLLLPARLFDGQAMHEGWAVLVEGNRITAAGPLAALSIPAGAEAIELPGHTLMPGLIEGHAHLLLYPYNRTDWNDQVLKESNELRAIRGAVQAEKNLLAGFTTVRELGTEGAGYVDVALKQAIEQGIIPGPRLIVSGRAIVATGSYGPKGFRPDFEVPPGAEPADGDAIIRVVRGQIGKGADFIKVYADYRWGPMEVLRAATAVNAEAFHLPELGRIREGFLADLIALEGNPADDISSLRKVRLVMKDGVLYKKPE